MRKFLILLTFVAALLAASTLVISADGADTAAAAESESFFEQVYEFVSNNADKILSAMAFSASLALALIYRRSLIPILKGSIGAISGTVSTLKEDSEKCSVAARDILESAAAKRECAQKLISELSDKLTVIEEELQLSKEEAARSADLRTLIGTQIDLLHDIFMASSLPYYRKEEVAEKVSEMKKTLASHEVIGDE
jgi:hypothetical protein